MTKVTQNPFRASFYILPRASFAYTASATLRPFPDITDAKPGRLLGEGTQYESIAY